MIAFLQSMPAGNAARVILAPPAGAERLRVLRKLTDDIASEADSSAAIVYDVTADDEVGFVDYTTLTNETVYYYQPFYLVAGTWVTADSSSVLVRSSFGQAGPDAFDLIRQRLDLGLRAEVAAGRVIPSSAFTDRVVVLTAPPLYDGAPFPLVTVHLQSDSPEVRGLGMDVAPAYFDPDESDYVASEGALNRVEILIVAHCVANPDVRLAFGKALKRVLTVNRALFEAAGILTPTYSVSHAEDLEGYAAPLYQAVATFSCLAPDVVTFTDPAIADVDVVIDVPLAA